MLKDIIIAALLAEGVASAVIAYKSYKAVKDLKIRISATNATVEELQDQVESVDIKDEVYKHFYNLVYLKPRIYGRNKAE